MHYVVFLPELSGGNPDHLVRAGLQELTEGASFADFHTAMVPEADPLENPAIAETFSWLGNAAGSLVFWKTCPEWRELRYFHWEPAEENTTTGQKRGRYWIGWDPESPPTADDLKRVKQYGGHWTTLGNGEQWLIPSYMRLDHVFRMGTDGEPIMRPAPQWERFCKRSEEIQQSVFEAVGIANDLNGRPAVPDDPATEFTKVTVSGGVAYSGDVLSINYRLNVEIALMLGLLTSGVLPKVIAASIDLPQILATYGEKKTLDTVEIPVT